MDPVKITRMGSHTMVAGSAKAAVERAVHTLIGKGARLVSSIEPLGANWIATLEQAVEDPGDGCKVVRLGLQIIVTGPGRAPVQKRLDVLLHAGAVLKSGPELRDGQWIAVCDEGGVDKTVHRW